MLLRRRQSRTLNLASVLIAIGPVSVYLIEGSGAGIQQMQTTLTDSPLEHLVLSRPDERGIAFSRLPSGQHLMPPLTPGEERWIGREVTRPEPSVEALFALGGWAAHRAMEGRLLGPAYLGSETSRFPEDLEPEPPQ